MAEIEKHEEMIRQLELEEQTEEVKNKVTIQLFLVKSTSTWKLVAPDYGLLLPSCLNSSVENEILQISLQE